MENSSNYVIGDKEYTREELLMFGMQHYPKFYWIKRGVGLGLLFFGIVTFTLLLIPLILVLANGWDLRILYYLFSYIPVLAIIIAGIIFISLSFKKLPEEAYIKHAVDYYTKLNARRKKRESRVNEKQENKDIIQLKKYKELLDSGAITQEEYDAKKKEILG